MLYMKQLSVKVSQWVINRPSALFANPEQFLPFLLLKWSAAAIMHISTSKAANRQTCFSTGPLVKSKGTITWKKLSQHLVRNRTWPVYLHGRFSAPVKHLKCLEKYEIMRCFNSVCVIPLYETFHSHLDSFMQCQLYLSYVLYLSYLLFCFFYKNK